MVGGIKLTHGFQVAVDDLHLREEDETLEDGVGEPLDETVGEALVVVDLDQLVQIHPAQKKMEKKITLEFVEYVHDYSQH